MKLIAWGMGSLSSGQDPGMPVPAWRVGRDRGPRRAPLLGETPAHEMDGVKMMMMVADVVLCSTLI